MVDPLGLQEKPRPNGVKWLTADEFSSLYSSGLLGDVAIQHEKAEWYWRADIAKGARTMEYWTRRSAEVNRQFEEIWKEGKGRTFSFDFLPGNPTYEQLQNLPLGERFKLTWNHPGIFRGDQAFPLLRPDESVAVSKMGAEMVTYGVIGAFVVKSIVEALASPIKGAELLTETRRAAQLRRLLALGKDPARGGRFSIQEAATALRFEGQYGGRLARASHAGDDFVGLAGQYQGKTFNAMGSTFNPDHFNLGDVTGAIQRHFRGPGSSDHLIIDLTRLRPSQAGDLRSFVGSLDDSFRTRVFFVD